MTKTTKQCFDTFMSNVVNLDSDKTKIARTSRDTLKQDLISYANNGKIPLLFSGQETVQYGSFSRNTKIRPLDDIDLLLVLDAQGGKADTTKSVNKNYHITMPPTAKILTDCCENYRLNSRKVIELIKKALNDGRYGKADIHRNQEAVTLKMTSYDWNFDIVPAFKTDTNFFVIPDGNGSWKGTDPRIDQENLTTENQSKENFLIPIIRLMKYWKNMYWGDSVKSYLFENLIIEWSKNLDELPSSFQEIIKSALNDLIFKILPDFNDPKGFQGNINDVDQSTRRELALKATNCLEQVNQAIEFEKYGNNLKAIEMWKNIFGEEFHD